MIDLKLNKGTGDLEFEEGSVKLAKTKQDVAYQQIIISLNAFKGEWVFNTSFGVPWLSLDGVSESILSANGSKGLADFEIKRAILATEFARRIVSYTSSVDKYRRTLIVSFEVEIDGGDIISVSEFTI